MTIKKIFKEQYNFPNVTMDRFYVGIFLGTLTVVTFYLFFNVSREIIRISLSANEYYDLWVLTDRETWFYNLVFAFISANFGQGICFKIWFESPDKIFSNSYFNFKKKVIYNDSMFFNVNFLNLFAKTAVLYGIWGGSMSGYMLIDKTLKYEFFWFIIIILMHLEQWKTIKRIYRSKSIKWFIIFTSAIIIISFSLSFVNPIDYKSINEKFLSKSIDYNYKLERPESRYARMNYKYTLAINLYFVYPKDSVKDDELPAILLENKKVSLDKLAAKIKKELQLFDSREAHLVKVHIHCDKSTKMKHIKALKEQIAKAGIKKISLAVVPVNRTYPAKVYRHLGLESSLPDYSYFKENHTESVSCYKENEIIKIEILNNELVQVNNNYVKIEDLETYLKQLNSKQIYFELQFYTHDNVEYGTYILARDKLNESINHLWKLKQKELDEFLKTPFNLLELIEKHSKE